MIRRGFALKGATFVVACFIAMQSGCSKQENSTVYVKTKLAPITNLRAYSASGAAVALQWDQSVDTLKQEYSHLRLVVTDENQNVIFPGIDIPRSRRDTTIVGLTEGNVHTFEFTVLSFNDQIYDNSEPVRIQWAGASRFPIHPDSSIRVIEFSANGTTLCGLQFLNTDSPPYLPGVFRVDSAGRRQDKIDVFLREVPNSGGLIVIQSADQIPDSLLASGVRTKRTRFSNFEQFATNLNVASTKPPLLSTYTRDNVVMAPTSVTSGKIFYAITSDSNYVRVFVKRNASTQSLVGLTQGGLRFVEIQISYQAIRRVIYAKPKHAEVQSDVATN